MTVFTARDLADLATLLRAAARAEVMPRFRNLGVGDVRAKTGPLDLVTEADEAAERMITTGLRQRFPGCVVVGEEACAADPALLRGLEGAALAFVVDPIDGTANYAAGLPLFATMAAAIVHGAVVAAAIHDPVGDDTAFALLGAGAWMENAAGARQALRVAPPVEPRRMTGSVGWRYLPAELRATVCGNIPRLATSWDFRCSAHHYRLIAGGHLHYMLFCRLLPWDHAPGWLLHREAGGFSARFDGSPYDPTSTEGGLICAPDQASFLALRAALFG
jgi:fructose-1,6-bisphosphatase/inositol monophosphatase family enzyme